MQEQPVRKLRILIVDDDSLLSMCTADMVTDLGHSAVEASSAPGALRLIDSSEKFDAVITDYAMPSMTGLELGLKMRQINPGLPIILATGYGELPDRNVDFPKLVKPYTQDDLARILALTLKM